MTARGHRPAVTPGAEWEAENRPLLRLLAATHVGRLCAIGHGHECYRVYARLARRGLCDPSLVNLQG
jgi:hypothetical protein